MLANAKGGPKAITYIGSVVYMYASSLDHWMVQPHSSFPITRLWKKIPNPVLGPKDVRGLLVLRGFTGYDIPTCPYEHYSESFQFHWTCWDVFLPGTPIVI